MTGSLNNLRSASCAPSVRGLRPQDAGANTRVAHGPAMWLGRFTRMCVLAGVFALAACAPVRVREDAAGLRTQESREAQFTAQQRWSLTARLAVSTGEDGGNGELAWKQDGDAFDFTVHAPVTGKTWRLHGDARAATLEGVRDVAINGRDANELLRNETGWAVPMAELRYWVRALRAPQGRAQLVFDERGLPAELTQAGWKVEYRDWMEGTEPALPRKVFASHGKARVRLVVEQWQTP